MISSNILVAILDPTNKLKSLNSSVPNTLLYISEDFIYSKPYISNKLWYATNAPSILPIFN